MITRDELLRLLAELFDADDAHGTGFYNDQRWRAAYEQLRGIVEAQKNISLPSATANPQPR
jgi:hypothetical protein